MPILDPKTNKVSFFKMPVADPEMPELFGPGHAASAKPLAPSAYWGEQKLWDTRANNHNSMFDEKGRLWLSATVRGMDNPAFCKQGSDHPSAKAFPLDKSARQVAMLDPKTMKYSFIDTCFATHHLQFGYDANDTLWLSGTGPVAGWVNTKMFDETGDAAKSQGWSPFVLDTNGNGKRDDYVEPNQPLDPSKDKRIVPGSGPYAVMPSPVDGSIWYTVGIFGGPPGFLRFDPATGLSEVFMFRAGVRHPRRRHRQERRGLGVAIERSPRQLRPSQVQRPAQWAERNRQSLPGRLDLLSVSRPRLRRHRRQQRRVELLHLGRPAQHVSGLARTFRCPPPTSVTASLRSRTARWSCCASPTRWASMPRVSMGASTIRTPAGRAAACGAPTATARRGCRRRGKGSKPRAVHIQLRPDPLAH